MVRTGYFLLLFRILTQAAFDVRYSIMFHTQIQITCFRNSG